MKAHLIDTHLLVPRSRSSAKVKVKYQRHVSQKMAVSGALVFHKHTLFLTVLGMGPKLGKFAKNVSIFSKIGNCFLHGFSFTWYTITYFLYQMTVSYTGPN